MFYYSSPRVHGLFNSPLLSLKNFEELIGAYLPSHLFSPSTHRGTDPPIFTFQDYGIEILLLSLTSLPSTLLLIEKLFFVSSYHCTMLRHTQLLATVLSSKAHLLCCREVGTWLRPLPWELLLPLGALMMRTKFLFASLCYSFPLFSIFCALAFAHKKSWLLTLPTNELHLSALWTDTSKSNEFIIELLLAMLFEAQASEPVWCIYYQKWGLHCVSIMRIRRI